MPYTLLITDRDSAQLELYNLIFRADGHTLQTFSDGQNVLAYLREHTPDLAILETRTPTVDGFELCRTIRRIKRLREMPVILVTSQEVLSDEVKGLAKVVKADAIIPKPLGDKNLPQRVQTLLAEHTPHSAEATQDVSERLDDQTSEEEQEELLEHTLIEELHTLESERRRLHAALLPTDRSQEPKEMKKLRALVALQEEHIEVLEARRQILEARLARQKAPSRLWRWLP